VPRRIDQLPGLRRNVKTINDPGIVSVEFEQLSPRSVGFQDQFLLPRLKIDQTRTIWAIGEAAPLRRDNWRMITILPYADDPRLS
jgi:hypothetical protein